MRISKNREEALVLRVLDNQYTAARAIAKKNRDAAKARADQEFRETLIQIKQAMDTAHQEYLSGNWEIFGMFSKALHDTVMINDPLR
jgi:hypothetical protein